MVCVIPVSLSDRKFIPWMEKAFAMFPPGSGHRLLVVGSPNVTSDVNALAQSLSGYFAGAAQTYIFEDDSNLGWPTACNYYAQQTAFYLLSILAADELWLWLELDSTPLRAGWLDDILAGCHQAQMMARRAGKPDPQFFGARERTCLESHGALMAYEEAGEQMAAVGVYPADMALRVITLRTVTATNIPWYTFVRWYVMEEFADLPLIQNNWRTSTYIRMPDGTISCRSLANWAWDVHFNANVRADAVLLHGCKDGTLLELLAAPAESVKQEPTKAPAPDAEYWTDPVPEAARTVPGLPPSVAVKRSVGRPKKTTPGTGYWSAERRQEARNRALKWHEERQAAKAAAAQKLEAEHEPAA